MVLYTKFYLQNFIDSVTIMVLYCQLGAISFHSPQTVHSTINVASGTSPVSNVFLEIHIL